VPESPAAFPYDEYEALSSGAGLVDFSQRTLLAATGNDRVKFLHSFCTNEIRKLPVDAGCEAFVLNTQGKILGHVLIFAEADALVVETVPDQAERLLAHWERYVIREDVVWHDRSAERAEWLLAGAHSANVLAVAGAERVPLEPLSSLDAVMGGVPVRMRRVPVAGPAGFIIESARADFAAIGAALRSSGARACGPAAWHALRIEAAWPLFGTDITDKNLPQEVDRDATAIHFTKGCYLGQETVARIDALGHVNRLLSLVRFDGALVPAAGTELQADGQPAGQVTSATYSPRHAAPIALAYLRRGQHVPGTRLGMAGSQKPSAAAEGTAGLAEVIPHSQS
jgi:folate-binding protein YgfZ